jgi:flagellar biosynthesis/type III secretory pathway protein FliH
MNSSDRSAARALEEFVADDYFAQPDKQFANFQIWDPMDSKRAPQAETASDAPDRAGLSETRFMTAQPAVDDSAEHLKAEFERGFAEGKAAAEAEYAAQSEQLSTLLEALSLGHCDVENFYSPLKTLAVRIAEAVMKVELEESRASIERIAEDLLGSLSNIKDDPVRLYLSPEDLAGLSEEFKNKHNNVAFIEDGQLTRGSSYAEMNDKLVTDYTEERISRIVQGVMRHDHG